MSAVLQVRDLRVSFRQDGEVNQAVKGVSFSVARGETVALVGESGSGKSVSALSTVSLLGDSAIVEGSVTYDGVEMVGADEKHLMQVQREVEDAFIALAKGSGRPAVVLLDRGLMDGKAYMEEEQWVASADPLQKRKSPEISSSRSRYWYHAAQT